jgi:GWxTD domain-containing protein
VRHSVYNFNAEDPMRNRQSLATLAALLLTFAAFGIGGKLLAQTPSTVHKFVAGDSPSPLAGPYRTWLDEDVSWIISPDERSAYTALQTNPERLQFINSFWDRRNPGLTGSENKFREEHYRRLAYANQHFASVRPGWMSDRGHVYIVYGKPDSIDAHPSGASGETTPFEVWHYNAAHSAASPQAAAKAQSIDFKFEDTCHCGGYRLTSPLP